MIHEDKANTFENEEEEIHLVQEVYDHNRIKNKYNEIKITVHEKENDSQINVRWIINLGASMHVCNNVKYFNILNKGENPGNLL